MHLVREQTNTIRARDFIARALDKSHRSIVLVISFAVMEKLWFQRHQHSWHTGTATSIGLSIILIDFEGKLYRTRAARVCPYFVELSFSPQLGDYQLFYDCSQTTLLHATHRRATVSTNTNMDFVPSYTSKKTSFTVAMPSTSYTISVSQLDTFNIASWSVLLTIIKSHKRSQNAVRSRHRASCRCQTWQDRFFALECFHSNSALPSSERC